MGCRFLAMVTSTEDIISKANPMDKALTSGEAERPSLVHSSRDSGKAKECGSAKQETSIEGISVQIAKMDLDNFDGRMETSTKASSVKMSEKARESWTGATEVSIKASGNAVFQTVEVQSRLHSQESLGLGVNGQSTVSLEITCWLASSDKRPSQNEEN